MAAQSIQSFIGSLKQYKKNVLEVREKAEIAALSDLSASIQYRVFSKNQGTDLQSFGSYRSESYKAKRAKNGRQTDQKDLQFAKEGIPGSLRNSIVIGKNQGRNVLGFDSERSITIREGQEKGSKTRGGVPVKQIGFDIFAPNETEIDLAFDKYVEVIDDKLRELNNV